MILPKPRGPLGERVFAALRSLPEVDAPCDWVEPGSPHDEALTLWVLHELHYGGFEDVDDRAEWHPALLAVRHRLEQRLEERLRSRWAATAPDPVPDPAEVPAALLALVAADDGPSLADHVHRRATYEQALELLRQRSLYHLKEADPSTWTVPRLPVRARAALVELQYDEYGGGDPNRLHSHLFARGLAESGLRPEPGAYVDEALPEVLEMNNVLSLLGLHRRLRGAAMGHLAAFESTSSLPSRRMVQGLERLGFSGAIVDYYSEHVEADAVHEHLAVRDICGTLAEDQPDQAGEVLFGAFTCLDQERRVATALLAHWGVEP